MPTGKGSGGKGSEGKGSEGKGSEAKGKGKGKGKGGGDPLTTNFVVNYIYFTIVSYKYIS